MTGPSHFASSGPDRRQRHGLTLVEVIVVVAGTAVLAVMLFPVFARSRERARMSTCQSNLREYGAAFLMYSQDYDSTLPMWSVDVPYRPGELDVTTWDLLLRAYLNGAGAGRCPSDPAPAFFAFKDGSSVWRSYAVPRNVLWIPGEKDNPRAGEYPMKLARIRQPARTLLMIEKNQGEDVNGRPYPQTREPWSRWTNGAAVENFQQVAWERHGDCVNGLFADGHVKPIHGRRQGSFRAPPDRLDGTFVWPRLPGYVYKEGAGVSFDRSHNGNQFWQDCPIPGEAPFSKACQ